MEEQWNSYICKVNGNIASIFLNLALREHSPMPDKPWLLWVWVNLKNPRPDGLSDQCELESLIEVEDSLSEEMLDSCRAILAGTITTENRREFYYYGESAESFQSAVERALSPLDGYRFDTGTQRDTNWKQYLDVLYPSETDLQRIKLRDVH